MERRQLNDWLKILIWAAVICALLFALFQCEAARTDSSWVEAGNAELVAPEGFYQPWSALQVGRNAAFNIMYGTSYEVPAACSPEDVYEAMIVFWGQRWDNAVSEFSRGFFGAESPLVGWGYYVAAECVAGGIDLSNSVAALHLESSYGMGSHNYFGIICWSLAGEFPAQLKQFIAIVQAAQAQRGNDPAQIAGYYNCDRPAYMRNWCEIFGGVR